MAVDPELRITWKPQGRSGAGTLTAKVGDEVVHVDEGKITREDFRKKFTAALCRDRPAINREEVTRVLTGLAADAASKEDGHPDATAPEGSEFHVVRPERFVRPIVSALAIPERAIVGGKVTGRWMLYLRWSDGRRECVDLPPWVELPDKSRLWVHPEPPEPLPTTIPGWSHAARKAWLKGAPPCDPAHLFRRVCAQIARFIDLPEDKAPGITATLALWVLLTYGYPAFDAIPYLYIGGPLGSGKSRAFDILARLVFRPLVSSNLTAPCLFRTLHNQGGVLLLDEAERLRGSTPDVNDILSMLLAGYRRGGRATRLEPVGDSFRPVEFDVYGPKAIACISSLPPALASRCIPILMFRAAPGSPKPRRRIDADPEVWQALRDDLHAFALEYGSAWLGLSRRTDVCPAMSGRDFELWQPLLALADCIESAGAHNLLDLVKRHAFETIEADEDERVPATDETILRIVADKVKAAELFTAGDVLAVAQREEPSLFQKWTPRTVANRLRQYHVPPPRRKTHGRRVYERVTPEVLNRIQRNYGMDLGIASPSSPSSPGTEDTTETVSSAGIEGDGGDASDAGKGEVP